MSPRLICDNGREGAGDIELPRGGTQCDGMKHILLILTLAFVPAAADAACYADYKAKRENPLRLHYGVAEIPGGKCNRRAARQALAPRLERAGWSLLNVLSVFDESGLDERKGSAGQHFLRY